MFFQNSVANVLQQAALILEVMGLYLVIVSIFRKEQAANLEMQIDNIAEFAANRKINYESGAFLNVIMLTYFFIYFVMLILLYRLSKFLFADIDLSLYNRIVAPIMIISSVLVPCVIIFFLVIAINILRKKLNRSSEGNAIAGIGLILAAIGCLFELYQVITLCIYDGCFFMSPFGS